MHGDAATGRVSGYDPGKIFHGIDAPRRNACSCSRARGKNAGLGEVYANAAGGCDRLVQIEIESDPLLLVCG